MVVSEFYNNTAQIAGQNLEVMSEAFSHQRYFDKLNKFAGNVQFVDTRFNELSKVVVPFNDIDSFDFTPADDNSNVVEKVQVLNKAFQHINKLYNIHIPFSSLQNKDGSINNAVLLARVNALSKGNVRLSKMLLNGYGVNMGIYSKDNSITNDAVTEPKDIKELILLIENMKAQMNAKLGLAGEGFGVLLPYKYRAVINSSYAQPLATIGNPALGEKQSLYIPSLGTEGVDFDYVYPVVGETSTITLIYKPFCSIILSVLPQIIGQGIGNQGLSNQTEITEIGFSTASFINMDSTKYAIINQPLKEAPPVVEDVTRELLPLEIGSGIVATMDPLDERKLELLKELKVLQKRDIAKPHKKAISDFMKSMKTFTNISDLEIDYELLMSDIENTEDIEQ